MTITRTDIENQVQNSITDYPTDFDLDGIVTEIMGTYGRVNIDAIDSDEYWAIIERHDLTIA